MIPQQKWEWFGQAGHFICSDRCRFHLHTHVGRYCVSTVGDYYPPGQEMGEGRPTAIGLNRLFETMVFCLDKSGEIDGDELDMVPYNDRECANAGHLKMCRKWARKK